MLTSSSEPPKQPERTEAAMIIIKIELMVLLLNIIFTTPEIQDLHLSYLQINYIEK